MIIHNFHTPLYLTMSDNTSVSGRNNAPFADRYLSMLRNRQPISSQLPQIYIPSEQPLLSLSSDGTPNTWPPRTATPSDLSQSQNSHPSQGTHTTPWPQYILDAAGPWISYSGSKVSSDHPTLETQPQQQSTTNIPGDPPANNTRLQVKKRQSANMDSPAYNTRSRKKNNAGNNNWLKVLYDSVFKSFMLNYEVNQYAHQ